MKLMNFISNLAMPFVILVVIIYGVFQKNKIFDDFLEGAKEGLVTTFNIFPSIIAMIFAINIFLDSNVLDLLTVIFKNRINYSRFYIS